MILIQIFCLAAVVWGADGQRFEGRSSVGQPCQRGDGLGGVCRRLTLCFNSGGTIEAATSVKLCPFSTYGGAIVCCRSSSRIIAEKKCAEWESGGATGLKAAPVTVTHIVGGEEAAVGEFPHMASLLLREGDSLRHICGGSLIASLYILTAAHCVNNRVDQLEVRLGAHDLSNPTEAGSSKLTVLQVIMPSGYKDPARYHDIALLRLSKEVAISRRVRPACLPFMPNQLLKGAVLTVAGWGYQDGGIISEKLRKTDLGYDDQVTCNRMYSSPEVRRDIATVYPSGISNTIVCASKVGSDACKGDSGGPLMHGPPNRIVPTVIGIVSQGLGCNTTVAGTYTRVESYLDWIVDNVWPEES